MKPITFTLGEVATFYRTRYPELVQRGRYWRGRCPIHGGHNNSFSVDPATGRWSCFSRCGLSHSLIDFEMAVTGSDFKAGLASVCTIIGRQMPEPTRVTADEWRTHVDTMRRKEQELSEARYFAAAAAILAELDLEAMEADDPARAIHTYVLTELRFNTVGVYRNWQKLNQRGAAGLVEPGRAHCFRMQELALRLFVQMSEEEHADAA